MGNNRPKRQRSGPPIDDDRDKSNDVTIKVANIKNIDSRTIVTDVPDWLRKYGLRSHRNNADLSITILNFDRPLADLKKAFPQLQFDNIDDKTRTITASEVGS